VLALAIYFERRSTCGRDHKTERWHGLARAFAVDHVYVIDHVHLSCFEPKFESFDVVESLSDIDFDGKWIFVSRVSPPNRELISLSDFHHPEGDVLYIIGGDAIGIRDINSGKETSQEGLWLKIPTKSDYELWAEQAGAIVLADRYMKCR